ncbi:MAG: hypothetical protein GY774_21045 [Planctomycetes bacterium]|nr:hypothetical protein [Planctomycetota bacterium]
MKKVIVIILLSISIMVPVLARQSDLDNPEIQPKIRFATVHIYLDSGNKPLAAYQFELKATTGQIKIVGVEGGQHKAFEEAPYYDPTVLHDPTAYYDPTTLRSDRIIIAAFNTGSELPKGRTRITTIHLQIIGDAEPDYELKLIVAADADANEIPAKISFEKGE